jgi:hypothetical protein
VALRQVRLGDCPQPSCSAEQPLGILHDLLVVLPDQLVLADEPGAPDGAVVAAWQRAVAELPAGPLAAEAQLRLGEAAFDSGDARRLGKEVTSSPITQRPRDPWAPR